MEKLLILDSNSIINRTYHGIRPLSAPDGTPTNAVYGFINILLKLINDHQPDYILAAFDLKAPTFRHKMYKEYKANRHGMPDELAAQMPVMKSILSEMNIPILQLEGYEADDIIGTVSRICGEKAIECFIATGDRDDLQLADNGTTVILASTRQGQSVTELFDEEAVFKKYAVTPSEFVDLKALMGDKSDNIPGVAGVGEKTAAKLIAQFSNIENMYENIEQAQVTERIKAKLLDGKEDAFLSKKLARIDTHVPIEIDFENGKYNVSEPDYKPGLYTALSHLGLRSTIAKMRLTPPTDKSIEDNKLFFNDKNRIKCQSGSEFTSAIQKLGTDIAVYADIKDGVLTAFAAASADTAYYIDSAAPDADKAIYALLEDEKTAKCTVNYKEVIKALDGKCEIKGVDFDCGIAAYLDNPSQNLDIDSLAARYAGVYLEQTDGNMQLSLFDDDMETDTAAQYALIIYELKKILAQKIEQNEQQKLFYEVEMPLITVLASMELIGITLDAGALKNFGSMLSVRIKALETAIYDLAGEEFNINSPKQLGVILFDKMGLPHGKKTKSGWSTKAEILEKLSGDSEIVRLVLEYRTHQKLKSTYCDSLGALVNPNTQRIHTSFNQTGTVTGRLSSSDPNLQNIPTRTELGRELRKMFVAADGCVLVDADYSQIELRILAHLSQDENMMQAFRNGMDIHAATASQVLGIAPENLTKEQRASAKAINFGIVYGISEFSLAKDLGISFYEAKKYMDGYFTKYSGVYKFMENVKKQSHETNSVKTMMNRVRYIPELNSSNANLRNFGERAAMNTPVQGTAADIIKLAMVNVYKRLKAEGLKSKLLLQVHDELIIEAPLDEVDKVKELLENEMENTIKLDVPLLAEAQSGKSWYDAK